MLEDKAAYKKKQLKWYIGWWAERQDIDICVRVIVNRILGIKGMAL